MTDAGKGRVSRAVTIADLRELARRRLPEFVFKLLETGAGNGDGVARNVARFDPPRVVARALTDVTGATQAAAVFGRAYASPFGISAVGFSD